MVTFRSVAVLIFSALLTGCFANRCPAPGYPSPTDHHPCYYKLEVVSVDQAKGLVETRYPQNLMGKDQEFEGATKDKFKPFLVRDLDRPKLEVTHVYMFTNRAGSPYLEAFPEGYDFSKETKESPWYGFLRVIVP